MVTHPRPPQAVVDGIIQEMLSLPSVSQKTLDLTIRKHLKKTKYRFPIIAEMVRSYRALNKNKSPNLPLERLLRCKTVRTDSGVAPITL